MIQRARGKRHLHQRAQHGAALLILAALLVLGGAWLMVATARSAAEQSASNRQHNARVLMEAKQALISYVVQRALDTSEDNPGRMPCPEEATYAGTTSEGILAIGNNCTLPAVGRLPWRTLGLPKLLDASGEPLWYVLSPGWAKPYSTATIAINSNTVGQLAVDGQSNAAIALIVAPGTQLAISPTSAQIAEGCAARVQARTSTVTLNHLDYLECHSVAGSSFRTAVSGNVANTVFNDQVVVVTTADLLPGVEAAVAKRIERDIVPQLSLVYADSASWGTSATTPAFPFATPFGDPSTSGYVGQAGTYQGLLPFNYHSSTCPGGDPRCSSNTISWGTPSLSTGAGPGYLPSSPSCYVSGSNSVCEGYYYGGTLGITLADSASNITTGLRTVNTSGHTGSARAWRWTGSAWVYLGSQSATTSRSLTSGAALQFAANVTLPSVSGWGYYIITAARLVDSEFGDHPLLSSATATTGWFVSNEWYRHVYYAIAPGHAPGGSLSCNDSGTITCLQVTNLENATKQRAILVLVGRSLATLAQSRPSAVLQNYLDSDENRDGNTIFNQARPSGSSNDRFISLSRNP